MQRSSAGDWACPENKTIEAHARLNVQDVLSAESTWKDAHFTPSIYAQWHLMSMRPDKRCVKTGRQLHSQRPGLHQRPARSWRGIGLAGSASTFWQAALKGWEDLPRSTWCSR